MRWLIVASLLLLPITAVNNSIFAVLLGLLASTEGAPITITSGLLNVTNSTGYNATNSTGYNMTNSTGYNITNNEFNATNCIGYNVTDGTAYNVTNCTTYIAINVTGYNFTNCTTYITTNSTGFNATNCTTRNVTDCIGNNATNCTTHNVTDCIGNDATNCTTYNVTNCIKYNVINCTAYNVTTTQNVTEFPYDDVNLFDLLGSTTTGFPWNMDLFELLADSRDPLYCPNGTKYNARFPSPDRVLCPRNVTTCYEQAGATRYEGILDYHWKYGCDVKDDCENELMTINGCVDISDRTRMQFDAEIDDFIFYETLCCNADGIFPMVNNTWPPINVDHAAPPIWSQIFVRGK